MKDEIRSNAKKTLFKLKSLGGKRDNYANRRYKRKALEVANELGIDRVYAELKPTDKAKILDELKNSGRNVVFCGDG